LRRNNIPLSDTPITDKKKKRKEKKRKAQDNNGAPNGYKTSVEKKIYVVAEDF
jgi:hypothetical protein